MGPTGQCQSPLPFLLDRREKEGGSLSYLSGVRAEIVPISGQTDPGRGDPISNPLPPSLIPFGRVFVPRPSANFCP